MTLRRTRQERICGVQSTEWWSVRQCNLHTDQTDFMWSFHAVPTSIKMLTFYVVIVKVVKDHSFLFHPFAVLFSMCHFLLLRPLASSPARIVESQIARLALPKIKSDPARHVVEAVLFLSSLFGVHVPSTEVFVDLRPSSETISTHLKSLGTPSYCRLERRTQTMPHVCALAVPPTMPCTSTAQRPRVVSNASSCSMCAIILLHI